MSVCQWILSLAVHQDSLNTPETTQQHTQQLDTTCVQDMILFLCCSSQSWAEGRRFSKMILQFHLCMNEKISAVIVNLYCSICDIAEKDSFLC